MVRPATQIEHATEKLRQHILDMAIQPGERITERYIENVLGVSRTSIRTALFHLENEGLVTRKQRGWQVSPIDLNEISQLCDYRIILETSALQYTTHDIIEHNIEEGTDLLYGIEHHKNYDEFYKAGSEFHVWIASLSKNTFIIQGVENATLRLRRARWLAGEHNYGGAEGQRDIVNALVRNDIETAISLTKDHLSKKRDSLIKTLNKEREALKEKGSLITN